MLNIHKQLRLSACVALGMAVLLAASSAYAEKSEAELLAKLNSDAPAAEKAVTCKYLAIYGTTESVPTLGKLLVDPELASWARIALEAIPGPEANKALRDATGLVEGRLLVGTINSIGVRRDAESTETLAALLKNSDDNVAAAAAVALGRIAGSDAAQALTPMIAAKSETVRSAVAEGCILCAEQCLANQNTAEAIKLYDLVRQAEVPKPRMLEATRGAILARGQLGVPLLVTQLRSDDRDLFRLGLTTARQLSGRGVDQALVAELANTTPERAALLVQVLTDRPKQAVLPAIMAAAEQSAKPVRLAAISALGQIGDSSCLDLLFEFATSDDAEESQLAKKSLATIPGSDVDTYLLSVVNSGEGKAYPVAIALVGERRIDATGLLKPALESAKPSIRQAALVALGEVVQAENLSLLVDKVLGDKHSEDLPVAIQALKTASVRMPDREACAAELSAAVEKASSIELKSKLLEIVAAVSGTKALATVGDAAVSDEKALQDVGTRLLGKWSTADAAPVLLKVATSDNVAGNYQVRALRGYIRIARQLPMDIAKRSEMCRQAWQAATRTNEQQMVLEVLERYPSQANLELANEAQDIPELKEQATKVSNEISNKLKSS
ncbi:HEAT repeat domain-containing protein [Aeoliella mucimassa]|nr:HEAT repeat domain-containing protein [Aeoliella mucimassa]